MRRRVLAAATRCTFRNPPRPRRTTPRPPRRRRRSVPRAAGTRTRIGISAACDAASEPVSRDASFPGRMAGLRRRLWLLAGVALFAAIVVVIVAPPQAAEAGGPALLSLYSLARVFAAHLISLLFPIPDGTTPATDREGAAGKLALPAVPPSL